MRDGQDKGLRQYLNRALTMMVVASLAGLAISFFIVDEWLQSLLQNIGTEIFGVAVGLLVINQVVDRYQERDRQKLQSVALQQLLLPIRNHLSLLTAMYIESVGQLPDYKYDKPSDFLTEEHAIEIANLDMSKSAHTFPDSDWYDFLAYSVEDFQRSVNQTIDKYTNVMDLRIIELTEQINYSNFFSFALTGPTIKDIQEHQKVNNDVFDSKAIIEHMRQFSELIDLYHELVFDDMAIGIDRHFVKTNPGRIQVMRPRRV